MIDDVPFTADEIACCVRAVALTAPEYDLADVLSGSQRDLLRRVKAGADATDFNDDETLSLLVTVGDVWGAYGDPNDELSEPEVAVLNRVCAWFADEDGNGM